MIDYKIINSGSDGNATIIEKHIMVDCGLPFSWIEEHLNDIKIILLTHIHGDHFKHSTIKKIASLKPNIRFACCDYLVKDLVDCKVDKKNIDVLKTGKLYNYNTFKISPVKAYHDVPNVGYRIYLGDKKALYITDTSTLNGISAKDYDLYLVEADYDDEELEERIRTKRENKEFVYEHRVKETHLSKKQCLDFFFENCKESSVLVFMHQHKEKKEGITNAN